MASRHHNCFHQRGHTHNVNHPFQVIGQNMQAHLGADPVNGPGQEMAVSHP